MTQTTTNAALFTFVKLTVRDMDAMTRFLIDGFGMTHADTIDTPAFCEHVMTGKKGSASIVLFHWKDGRDVTIGNGWGPVGMMTRDLDTDLARAIAAGGQQRGDIQAFGTSRIAFVLTPEGHEIEMMQMGAPA